MELQAGRCFSIHAALKALSWRNAGIRVGA